MCFFAQFAWLRIDSVVSHAVVEHQNDVIKERFDLQVIVIFQFFCNRSEVHRFLNYWEVVRNLQFFRVNCFSEYPRWVWLWKGLNHSKCNFFPVVEDVVVRIIHVWNLNRLDFGFIEKIFEKLWMFLCFHLKFLHSDGSVLLSIFDQQWKFLIFLKFIFFKLS